MQGSYQVQSNVWEEILLIFIEYLQDGKNPEIHFGNFMKLDQMYQLSKEFGLEDLKNYIIEKKAKWEEYEHYLDWKISRIKLIKKIKKFVNFKKMCLY